MIIYYLCKHKREDECRADRNIIITHCRNCRLLHDIARITRKVQTLLKMRNLLFSQLLPGKVKRTLKGLAMASH